MKKALFVAFLVLSVFALNACSGSGCESGGCRDKISSHSSSHGKARGR